VALSQIIPRVETRGYGCVAAPRQFLEKGVFQNLDRSYRSLFAVPSVGRLLLGMQIARIAQSMVAVTIVLFALALYRSPEIAGAAAFFNLFPGLVVSPIAGALLDRHGRRRLVVIDYLVALASLVLIGALALLNALPAWLLFVVASIASLTAPLSSTGLRSVLPLIVPVHLWERVNAIDSIGYVAATVVGPPLAGVLFSLWGGPATFIVIGLGFGLAAVVIARTPDPLIKTAAPGRLLHDAWRGLVYTWRNPTLRGLGFSLSVLNLAGGIFNIVIPLIVLERLHFDERVVGLVIAAHGLAGMISALWFGRVDSLNRERTMMVVPMIGWALASALLLLDSSLVMVLLVWSFTGILNGPLDIALFTVRQRRTDPVWTGRAFAISMSFNALGVPVGAALAGVLAARSIELGIGVAVCTSLIAAVLAALMIPATDS
jgi:MFS family permease